MIEERLVDTNVILRLIIGDVPAQKATALKLFQKVERGELRLKVSVLVVNELIWILEKFYKLERTEYLPILFKLLSVRGISILEVKKRVVLNLIEGFEKSNLDLTDLYLAIIGSGSNLKIESFDSKLKRTKMAAG